MRLAWICPLLILAAPAHGLDLTLYTEEFPPFNYRKDGKIVGVSTEVVNHIMADTGYTITIKSLPWSEAYERAQNEESGLSRQ